MLITGPCCVDDEQRAELIEEILRFPGIVEVLAKGDNKVSFKLRSGMQVDVRTLPPESYGAAMQYFTGSKNHNVTLRQRALKMGYTLNEYGLFRLEDNQRVAGTTEDEIYGALKLDCIPPELRENCGEIEAAAKHALPKLITVEDIRGEVHMHTVETDGRCTIEEMAEAAKERGYQYIAITDHSKNLAFANGLDDKRAESTSRAFAQPTSRSRASRSWRASKSTFWPMANSICRTRCWSRWTWWSPAYIRRSTRSRSR